MSFQHSGRDHFHTAFLHFVSPLYTHARLAQSHTALHFNSNSFIHSSEKMRRSAHRSDVAARACAAPAIRSRSSPRAQPRRDGVKSADAMSGRALFSRRFRARARTLHMHMRSSTAWAEFESAAGSVCVDNAMAICVRMPLKRWRNECGVAKREGDWKTCFVCDAEVNVALFCFVFCCWLCAVCLFAFFQFV